ncbi:hypothetical protein BGZ94_006967 [Podila epigama]|nr:hypothetical protein BGZ94_006967 [Podila epigama]
MTFQSTLQEHLNNATLASLAGDGAPGLLRTHLDAFTRAWHQAPSLDHLDSALQLLGSTRQGIHHETVANWWLTYIQDIVLSPSIPRLSPALGQAIFRSIGPLADLLQSPSPTILKRAIQVCASIYPVVFQISSQDSPVHLSLWNECAVNMKQLILRQFSNINEGVVISLCKYLQTIIQIQSFSPPQQQHAGPNSLALNYIPPNHPFLNVSVLQQEADRLLQDLLSVIRRPNVTSTLVTAVVNQTSTLQRTRPQFMPTILRTWMAFTRPPPPHFTALQTKFVDKAIRIQILALTKADNLQPPQHQVLTEALATFGIKYEGKALSRSQQQQLLHPDRENGDDKKSGKRVRSSGAGGDDTGSKRIKSEPDTSSTNIVPPAAPTPVIPPKFGATLLGQINITQLPLHHVVDVIFETLVANPVPHLFHSFLTSLQTIPLKPGPLPIPPPGVGPPPPGILLPPLPPMLPGMMMPPPPGGMFPPPPMMPGPPGQAQPPPAAGGPEVKQEIKKEPGQSKLKLPTVSNDTRVNVVVMPPKHTPVKLPPRPIVARTDSVIAAAPARKKDEKEPKVEPKVEAKLEQHQLKKETFQIKPFEPSDQYPTDVVQAPARDLLKETFLRILGSEHLVSVPAAAAAAGKKVLEIAAASGATAASSGENSQAVVPSDGSEAEHSSKVVTKVDWMKIVARLLTRAFPRNSEQAAAEAHHGNQHMKDMMVNYVCSDFKQRRDLALIWLHEEWRYDDMCQRDGEQQDREPQYLWCLYKILDGITSGATQLDSKDRGLSRFLLEVPELPEGAVDIIQKYCDDPARVQVGMSCLRDIVNLRPTSRDHALEIILRYTAHPERHQRTLAIITAKKWYLEHETVGPRVEQFALTQLEALRDYPVPKREEVTQPTESASTDVKMTDASAPQDEHSSHKEEIKTEVKTEVKDEPMPNAVGSVEPAPAPVSVPGPGGIGGAAFIQAEEDIGRLLDLYFSLCAKNNTLLQVLFTHYGSFDPFVQRVVRVRIPPLIKAIKQDSPKLLVLIRDFPLGAEMLILRIVNILTDGVRPAPELVSAVQQAVVQHDLNARFLVPIVSGLNKEEALAGLPRIVGLLKGTERERRTVTDVFLKLLTGGRSVALGNNNSAMVNGLAGGNRRESSSADAVPGQSLATVSSQSGSKQSKDPILSPSELLIELHLMEDTVGWKAACEAMDICFNHPEIYKSEIIAVVLQQLLDQPTIPSLFMRTVIQAITLYKNLVGFVNSMILARLVGKKVWTRPVLWKGFVRCAKLMQPTSSSVLATLPKPQLKEVLAMEPSLKEAVDAYNKAKSSGRRVGGGAAKQVNMQNVAAVAATSATTASTSVAGGVKVEGEGVKVEVEAGAGAGAGEEASATSMDVAGTTSHGTTEATREGTTEAMTSEQPVDANGTSNVPEQKQEDPQQ